MKAEFTEIIYYRGKPQANGHKTIELPFDRVAARALLLRRRDGAILGVLHRPDGRFALPGGGIDDGETPAETLCRELQEEGISLIGAGDGWQEQFGVDYYAGYRELNFWFLITVEDVEITPNHDEIVAYRWIGQTEDAWYPSLYSQIISLVNKYAQDLSQIVIRGVGR